MHGEENITSGSDPQIETTPHLHYFVPLDRGIYRRKKDDMTKKNAQGRKSLLKQCKKGCLALGTFEPEKAQFNGLDQKLYER